MGQLILNPVKRGKHPAPPRGSFLTMPRKASGTMRVGGKPLQAKQRRPQAAREL